MKRATFWLALLLSLSAVAGEVSGPGYRIEIPAGWESQRDLMGVPLMARPARAQDPQGWGADLITVTVEAPIRADETLAQFAQRKLGQIRYHATRFELLEQPAEANGAIALSLRYSEGSRHIRAQLRVSRGPQGFVTATALSSPERYPRLEALLLHALQSLRDS